MTFAWRASLAAQILLAALLALVISCPFTMASVRARCSVHERAMETQYAIFTPGMDVHCWSDERKAIYDECGELVCMRPFPSQVNV